MPRYDAYLLRVWRGGPDDGGRWAGRLEHLPDGVALRFGTLAALLAYLHVELACVDPASGKQLDEAATDDTANP